MKKMRNTAVVVLFMAMATVSCVSQTGAISTARAVNDPAPQWMNDLDSVYPDSQYIAAVGTGDTRRDAESDASGSVARRFNVDIKADTQAQKRYHEVVSNEKSYNESDVSIVDKVSSSANEQLKDLKFSDPYVDAKGQVNIVAYLDRNSVANLYRTVITKDKSVIDSLRIRADSASSALVGFAILDSAVVISMNSDRLISQLQIISPATAKVLASQVDTQSLIAKRDAFAQKLGYTISIDGDTDGKVAGIIRKALGTLKIPYNAKGNLQVQGTVSMESVEVNPQFKSVRWTLTVGLMDETGASIANFFKESRENAISDPEARAFAIKSIEKGINKDFLESLNSYLAKAGQSGN